MDSCVQILLLSKDLMVSAHVEGAARRSGATMQTASDTDQLLVHCNENFQGIVLIDLSLPGLEIGMVISELKSISATAFSTIAFGPHVHAARLAAARESGCNQVISRGELHTKIDEILNT